MTKLDQLYDRMISYDGGNPHRIQHFTKVLGFSKYIGTMEQLDVETQFTLEATAIVHDIGIKAAEETCGHSTGKLQEELGPALVEEMLGDLDFSKEVIARVAYLVGHHHTYDNIDGLDYQILVEADFLVNLHEKNSDVKTVQNAYHTIFRTQTGKSLCRRMFGFAGME
ncbi:HD domain-containing protein [Chakrabartyella piscis]|uniref:HD domain-containing protein n=1 Tax=Chakrabartyella piscis TaxID=2918914 RepID=UPI0029586880|nr:HD domain-containing protein [Chakrabartyella piscis]